MKLSRSLFLSLALGTTLVFSGCETTTGTPPVAANPAPATAAATETPEATEPTTTYLFGWGQVESATASPRGGSSRGAPVERAAPQALPSAAITAAKTDFERDRAAILSLAGDYEVSFHFLETLGLFAEHETVRPYHSWATEKVHVLEDTGEFISLQHTLVMFFKQDDGTISEPMLVKHWRQDWTYQDTDLHTFRGNRTWERETRSADEVAGTWSQSVWQVDDSPRYEAIGRWEHLGNRSSWTGENTWRPLPRREHSIRDDYTVMEGFHRITLTPTGWMHEQNNWKRVSGDDVATAEYRAHEIGLDRYQRITSPALTAADDYWAKTHAYWQAVREAWTEVYAEHDRFSLREKIGDQRLFMHHFEFAGKLADGEEGYDEASAVLHAHETVAKFLIPRDATDK